MRTACAWWKCWDNHFNENRVQFRQLLNAPSWLKSLQFPNVSFGQEWHCYRFTSTPTPERNHLFLANSPVTQRILLIAFSALQQLKQHILSVSHWFQEISVVKKYRPCRPLTTGPGLLNVIFWGRLKYLGQNWHWSSYEQRCCPNIMMTWIAEKLVADAFFASGSPP